MNTHEEHPVRPIYGFDEDEDSDFDDSDDPFDLADDDPGSECGRWVNGRLTHSCSKAGSEECDFECPYRDTLKL